MVLFDLQTGTKWNISTRNCKVGDIVLLKNETEQNQWLMAHIMATNKGNKGRCPKYEFVDWCMQRR